MKIENELINIAIEELRTKKQKITVSAIAKISGYPAQELYTHSLCRPFVRKTSRGSKATVAVFQPSLVKRTNVEQSVDAYAQYIKDSYFSHPEPVNLVRDEMLVEVAQFNASLFSQAVNLLIVQGWLKASTFNPDTLVRAEVKSEAPIAQVVAPEPTPEPVPVPAPVVAKPAPVYEKAFQWPLTQGVFTMTLPSVLSEEDESDVWDYFMVITKRFKLLKGCSR